MQQFSTYDLSLSAALATKSYQLMDGELDEVTNKMLFYFLDSPELRKEVETYYKGQLLIEPQRFFANLKLIKNLIHAHDEHR